jgi:hypothetical protein
VSRPCGDVYRSLREGASKCFEASRYNDVNLQVDSTWHEEQGRGHVTVRTVSAGFAFLTAGLACRKDGTTAVLVEALDDPDWRAQSALVEPWARGKGMECR